MGDRKHRKYITRGPWRIVAAAAVAASMAMGPATAALAVTPTAGVYGTGNITITNVKGNVTKFKGHQVFKANVRDDSGSSTGKVEVSLSWYSDTVRDTTVAFIKSKDSSYKGGNGAQDAADWLQAHITNTDDATRVNSGSLADDLAHRLDAVQPSTAVEAGTKTKLDEGWWLFTTYEDTIGTDEVGTAPIFTVVGGSDVSVTEKAKPLTVEKLIQSDADGSWGKVADHNRSQTISYKLVGTVPDNIGTFDTYFYQFVDGHSEGVDVDLSSVKVKVYPSSTAAASDPDGTNARVGVDVTSKFETKTLDSKTNTLTVGTADLKTRGASISQSTVVVCYYKGKLNGKAVIGPDGNPNTVYLRYSNNPYDKGIGQTHEDTVRDYTYRLVLNKVDRDTEVRLQGAKVTIRATGADDEASKPLYVQADGTLGKDPHEFETGSDGTVTVEGLDAGTYTVAETQAPDGYDPIDPYTFSIEPTYGGDDGETLTSLSTTVSGKRGDVIAGVSDGVTNDNALVAAKDSKATDKSTGTVQVTMGDIKRINLPLTGSNVAVLTIVVGAAGVTAGVVWKRRQDKRDGGSVEA